MPQAGLIEKHPERRFKAAFEAYLERETPILRQEVSLAAPARHAVLMFAWQHPGLRKQQMHDMLFKQFQKAPENPQVFAQYTVAPWLTSVPFIASTKCSLRTMLPRKNVWRLCSKTCRRGRRNSRSNPFRDSSRHVRKSDDRPVRHAI